MVFTVSQCLLNIMSIESVMPSNHVILCHTFLLPSVFPIIKIFSNASALHISWPNYWSFSTSPSNEYPELISFRMDQFDFLSVQTTLKSLLQHHSLKASILRCSAFPGGLDGKASASKAGDLGSIPGLERSLGEGNGTPLQYSCLENPMDRGAWQATDHAVTESRTRLRDFTITFFQPCLWCSSDIQT